MFRFTSYLWNAKILIHITLLITVENMNKEEWLKTGYVTGQVEKSIYV